MLPSATEDLAALTHIVGLHKRERDEIRNLYRHIETPELSMHFKWTPNSVAFWDNRCTQHHALWYYYPHSATAIASRRVGRSGTD
jgi:taurine dioxygenase